MENTKITIEEMEQLLRDENFYVGGLTDEGIEYHYNMKFNNSES